MSLSLQEKERYTRQLLLKEIGSAGQEKLKLARVLVVGAGGLGCPVLHYLAGAGVGTLGVMDFDVVSASNLHRQILFNEADKGKSKAMCAAEKLKIINPFIIVNAINERLTVKNIRKVFSEYDLIVDGTDNFSTRYLINDGCVLAEKPWVFGSLYKFSGQVAVFNQLLKDGTRSLVYRDVFPAPPQPGSVTDCDESGVAGPVAGMIGTMQAIETIKLITGAGNTLAGKLLIVDSLNLSFNIVEITGINAPSKGPTSNWNELELVDYEPGLDGSPRSSKIDSFHFDELINKGSPIQVIDVREEWEVTGLARVATIPIPLYELTARLEELEKSKTTVVICAGGKRSEMAVKLLQAAGFRNVMSLEGGINAWLDREKV